MSNLAKQAAHAAELLCACADRIVSLETQLADVTASRDHLVNTVIAHLQAQLAEVTRERDEARDWVRKLTREERVLTCIYCGHAYPPGSPTHGAEVLTAHAMVCTKHPLAIAVEALEAIQRKSVWSNTSDDPHDWYKGVRIAEQMAGDALAAIKGDKP